MERKVKEMSDLMDVLTRYTESDNTKDPASDDEKPSKGRKNSGKGQQHNGNGNNNNKNNHKRKNAEGGSDFVANSNTGFRCQRQNGNFKPFLVIVLVIMRKLLKAHVQIQCGG